MFRIRLFRLGMLLALASPSGHSLSAQPLFPGPLAFPAGSSPRSVAVGDFNRDGRPDLAVADFSPGGTVSILLATENGGFLPPAAYEVPAFPRSAVVGDFDGDGNQDLAVDCFGIPATVVILRGRGDGTFEPFRFLPVGDGSGYLAVGDLNGDELPDLAVPNDQSNDVSVLINIGGGNFAPQLRFPVGAAPAFVAIGDLDLDGRPDIVVADSGSDEVSVRLGAPEVLFGPEMRYPAGGMPMAVAIGRFNSDAFPDLAVANFETGDVTILIGVGGGIFGPRGPFPAKGRPSAIVAADFNGDRLLDLAVADEFTNDVSILLGREDGSFLPPRFVGAGQIVTDVALGDFNVDGKKDLVVANTGSDSVSLLLGNGNGTFLPETRFGTGAGPFSIVSMDFNGDRRADLAIANVIGSDVSILLGKGDGSFLPQARFPVGPSPIQVVAGDFNEDGRVDLAAGDQDSKQVSILLGNGDGTFQPETRFALGDFPNSIAVGDFNGDGHQDIVAALATVGEVAIALGVGNGTFGPLSFFPTGTGPFLVVVADLNGDGRPDLAVANHATDDVSVLLGHGDGTFAPQLRFAAGSGPFSLTVGDFNADGRQDLTVANADSDDISVLLGRGDGTFGDQVRYPAGDHPSCYAVGDLNADGNEDIVGANSNSNDISVLLGDGRGGFAPQLRFDVGTAPVAPALGDFDRDHRQDLAVVNFGSDNVSVLLNDGPFPDSSPPVCSGAPKTENGVLGIDGTATDSQPGDTGIFSVVLDPSSVNVSLTVSPFSPGAASVTFRAVQAVFSKDARGTVIATDGVGQSCTLPVDFTGIAAGAVEDQTICSGEGILLSVTGSAPSSGTAACSSNIPTSTDPTLPLGYEPSPATDPSPCRVLTIASLISGETDMVYKKDGDFDPRLRLLFSRSPDGGLSFPAFTDVTESVEPIATLTPDPTRLIGKGTYSMVKVSCAIQAEICDGIDNDGDGLIDEGLPVGGPAVDEDGDGYPLCPVTTSAASLWRTEGSIAPGTPIDCNDQNPAIHPGAPEICNGLDDNCDGRIDEKDANGQIPPGGGVPCVVAGNLGVCARGVTSCDSGPMICLQTILPSPEVCDGLDNDCDGVVDDGNPGGGLPCVVPGQQGLCAAGVTACMNGAIVCTQTVFPAPEVCDGLDNDCDGLIDDGAIRVDAACSIDPNTLNVNAAGLSFSMTVTLTNVCHPDSPEPLPASGLDQAHISRAGSTVMPDPASELCPDPVRGFLYEEGIFENLAGRTVSGSTATLKFNRSSDGNCTTLDGNRQDLLANLTNVADNTPAAVCLSSAVGGAAFECCATAKIRNHGAR